MDDRRSEGKVALISGVARGQGRAHALRLAREGAAIVGFDALCPYDTVPYPQSTQDDLDETAALLEAQGATFHLARADVRNRAEVEGIVAEGVDRFGGIDIVVANAGIGLDGIPFWEVTEQEWDDVIDVNLKGVWITAAAAAPPMISRAQGGSIIITSSAAALRTAPRLSPYTAAKTGVIGLMRAMATELARYRIRVNCVAPTSVPTDFIINECLYRNFCPDIEDPTLEDAARVLATLHPLGEPWIDTDDIAAAVAYLASDEARYITGTVLPVDMGLSFRW